MNATIELHRIYVGKTQMEPLTVHPLKGAFIYFVGLVEALQHLLVGLLDSPRGERGSLDFKVHNHTAIAGKKPCHSAEQTLTQESLALWNLFAWENKIIATTQETYSQELLT